MPIYDISGNVLYQKEKKAEFSNSQIDSIYAFMGKTAFLSNIEKEKHDFEQAFNLTRNNLYPIENVDSDFKALGKNIGFHARFNRGYHMSMIFYQAENYVVSFARLNTYGNQVDYLPSMYTFPANEAIVIGVSNVVMDGITKFAIRNRLADSNENGNVRTGEISSSNDFSTTVTLNNAEPTGAFYISADPSKTNAVLEFDFNLKVGDELWV